jgi:hypothetical protein
MAIPKMVPDNPYRRASGYTDNQPQNLAMLRMLGIANLLTEKAQCL